MTWPPKSCRAVLDSVQPKSTEVQQPGKITGEKENSSLVLFYSVRMVPSSSLFLLWPLVNGLKMLFTACMGHQELFSHLTGQRSLGGLGVDQSLVHETTQ